MQVTRGAFESYEAGRACEVSAACHWAVTMAAAANDGRMYGHAYSVGVAALMVPPGSPGEWPPSCQAASSRAASEAVLDTGGAGAMLTPCPRLSHCWASQLLQS